jgi:hypothetical protein
MDFLSSPESVYSQIRDDRSSPPYSSHDLLHYEEIDREERNENLLLAAKFERQMRLLRQFEIEKRRTGSDTLKRAILRAASSNTPYISICIGYE